MPSLDWSGKRKRQYQHIKGRVLARGEREPQAEEIAARIISQECAQQGGSKTTHSFLINAMPSNRHGRGETQQSAAGRSVPQMRSDSKPRRFIGDSIISKA